MVVLSGDAFLCPALVSHRRLAPADHALDGGRRGDHERTAELCADFRQLGRAGTGYRRRRLCVGDHVDIFIRVSLSIRRHRTPPEAVRDFRSTLATGLAGFPRSIEARLADRPDDHCGSGTVYRFFGDDGLAWNRRTRRARNCAAARVDRIHDSARSVRRRDGPGRSGIRSRRFRRAFARRSNGPRLVRVFRNCLGGAVPGDPATARIPVSRSRQSRRSPGSGKRRVVVGFRGGISVVRLRAGGGGRLVAGTEGHTHTDDYRGVQLLGNRYAGRLHSGLWRGDRRRRCVAWACHRPGRRGRFAHFPVFPDGARGRIMRACER